MLTKPAFVALIGAVNHVTRYAPTNSPQPTKAAAHAHALFEDAKRARGATFQAAFAVKPTRRPAVQG